MSVIITQIDKTALRRQLRQARRALTASQQRKAALDLAQRMLRSHWLRQARNIAFYLANDGEIDPSPLLKAALDAGKNCFLPRIVDPINPHMVFAQFRRGDPLQHNRFGIAEPAPQAPSIIATKLDLVLMPLVGFDQHGNRLGMGGGFYDRTLAYKRQLPSAQPHLIGLAHECQRVATLPADKWDITLDGVITDGAAYRFRF